VERLSAERMPLAGLVVNRASVDPEITLSEATAMAGYEKLRDAADEPSRMAAGLLRLHADRKLLVERESRLRARFATAHPQVRTAVLPALPSDVHDLDGLRGIGDLLAVRGA
jgi:hypothetical protein